RYAALKVAHHGSKNSTGEEILSYLSPDAALISCGSKNRYGHPHKELLGRLKACHSRVFRTDEGGAIQLRSDGRDFFASCYQKGKRK
ncbi:MAG TPA: DNA internalization-related competence protein ComEC/Rec2, partial [Lachnospiraceae bacterium]|nr:DNA internalization-related competence protein ComEC/Rec2 [Lachnospiraceae bacterium]